MTAQYILKKASGTLHKGTVSNYVSALCHSVETYSIMGELSSSIKSSFINCYF